MFITFKFDFLSIGQLRFFSLNCLRAVIITNWHEELTYFEYIPRKSIQISDNASWNIYFYYNMIVKCLEIPIKVIQGQKNLNFQDRSRKYVELYTKWNSWHKKNEKKGLNDIWHHLVGKIMLSLSFSGTSPNN